MLTQNDLQQIRTVIKDEIESVEKRLTKKIEAVDLKVEAVDLKIEAVDVKVKAVDLKVETVDLKVEAVQEFSRKNQEFNKKAHAEIMTYLAESNEVDGREIKNLEKRITAIEHHIAKN